MLKRKAILIYAGCILILLSCTFLSAQPLARQMTLEDGLPSHSIYHMNQDSLDRIWIGTDNGIACYESYGVRNYSVKDGLTSNEVIAVLVDRKGTVWANCFERWPCFLKGDHFVSAKDYFGLEGKLSTGNHVFFDNWAAEVYVSVALNQGQYYIFNLTTQEKFLVNGSVCSPLFIPTIKGEKYYVFSRGIYSQLDGELSRISGFDSIHPPGFYMEYPGPKMDYAGNVFWELINQDTLRKACFENGKVVTQSFFPLPVAGQLINVTPNNVFLIQKGRIYRFNGESVNLFFETEGEVRAIEEDRQGNFWVCTANRGIFLIEEGAPQYFKAPFGESFSTIKVDRDSVYVAGEHQLYRLLSERLPAGNQFYPLAGTNIEHEMGIVRVMEAHEGRFYFSKMASISFSEDSVRTEIVSDLDGRIGGGGGFKAILPINDSILLTGDWESFKKSNIRSGKNSHIWIRRARSLEPFGDNRYLLCGLSELAIYNFETNQVERTKKFNWVIEDIAVGDKAVFLLVDEEVVALDKASLEPISSFSIRQISANSPGNMDFNVIKFIPELGLIAASNHGWYRIDFDWEGQQWNLKEGWVPSDFSHENNLIDISYRQGKVYGLLESGVLVFDTTYEAQQILYCSIISFKASGKKLAKEEWGDINRRENHIQIQLNMVSSKHQPQIFYEYRLRGQGDDWLSGTSNVLEFQSLNPGTYQLEIKMYPYGGREAVELQLATWTIRPYFFETNWFLWIVILFSVLLTICVTLYFIKRKDRLVRNRIEQEQKLTALELQGLRAKMNPHFIFNSLNAIQSYFVREDVRSANYYLSRFASLVRNTLHSSYQGFLPLEEEMEFLESYLELEKMRLKERLSYEIIKSTNLNQSDIYLPQMLIQPFIENAILHGIPMGGHLEIATGIEPQSNRLRIEIRDNGIGILKAKERRKESHISKGSAISKARINLLRTYYQAGFEIQITDRGTLSKDETGTLVTIYIPLETDLK